MTDRRWHAAVAAAALLVIIVWPLSPALERQETTQLRIAASLLALVTCVVIALAHRVGGKVWTIVTLAAATAGVLVLIGHVNASATCTAEYDGRPAIIGRVLSPLGAEYVAKSPDSSATDLLLDAGGVPDRVWTTASIHSCRLWLGGGALATVPLFAAAVSASIARRRYRAAALPPVARVESGSLPTIYDAFISYRHLEPDRSHALALLDELEARGHRVAIDFRDFRPNEHFLSEMERCIRQSRFVLCVVTRSYLQSDHTSEEAIISKTIDLADRSRRLVPVVYDRVELPVWLHGLSGIDATAAAEIDPIERLQALLGAARGAAGASAHT